MTKDTLKKTLKEEKKQDHEVKETYLEDLKRVQAEFENYMKRVERERQQLIVLGKQDLLLKILQVYDDVERALQAARTSEHKEEIVKGIEMMFKQFTKLLDEETVVPITSLGEQPDPYKHDVIGHTLGKEEGVIVEEVKKGYLFHNKVLRPSMVKVSKVEGDKNE